LVLALAVLPAAFPIGSLAAQPVPPAAAPPGPPTNVSGPEMSVLIRNTIAALNDANITGNYSVLRDLGASVLQANNSAADLAAQFTDFRKQRLNLAATVLYDPALDQKPMLSTNGQLRLVGHFPTRPQEVVFDLTYLFELGAWRIAQISVATRPAPPGEAAAAPAPSPGPAPGTPPSSSDSGGSDAPSSAVVVPLPRERPAKP
jgi:hypothetical protein